ncbi:hypothetical protein BV898_09542 [Hypsibius exemplaris]|uniref:Bulb-type lectin domain-containing protein n=1 Tax=Hypsibius exemplaris TaxID=2072580 RepID=A0A1W0WMI3_HYPEX|nr:hypothetical protein BV898_09542 [Hypsibius exemplaris]
MTRPGYLLTLMIGFILTTSSVVVESAEEPDTPEEKGDRLASEESMQASVVYFSCWTGYLVEEPNGPASPATRRNLVLYRVEGAGKPMISVWATSTHILFSKPISLMVIQNGDLVLKNQLGIDVWRLGTAGAKFIGNSLYVLDGRGGTLCLKLTAEAACVWTSLDWNNVVLAFPTRKTG